jgi:hypothetical protein
VIHFDIVNKYYRGDFTNYRIEFSQNREGDSFHRVLSYFSRRELYDNRLVRK